MMDDARDEVWRRAQRWCAIVIAVHIVGLTLLRFVPMLDPWSFDGDQAQAAWQYWRYAVPGAFPPGDVQTDYAFVMHAPPAWWLAMSTLTTVLRSPLWAAKVLNLVSYFGTCALLYRIVARRTHKLVALAAVCLMLRTNAFYTLTAGGYARSFGPLLVLLFLDRFLERKHAATLAVLVLSAALYPSAMMPCALSYGVYVVAAAVVGVKDRASLRTHAARIATLAIAGVAILALGLSQELMAPKWWGHVVSVNEALKMPAWQAGGRINEAPLHPWIPEVSHQVVGFFAAKGAFTDWFARYIHWRHAVPVAVLVVAGIATTWFLRARARREGRELVEGVVPWELFLVFAATLASYALARALAFRLYFPYRVLAHVIPYLFSIAVPVFSWCLIRNFSKLAAQRAAVVVSGALVASFFVLFGTGVDVPLSTYGSVFAVRGFYDEVKKLPVDAVIAGQIGMLDRVPLFTWHRSYVMRDLAHPFRPGYYAEEERRIRVSYDALYATSLQDVVDILKRENVAYLMYDTGVFQNEDPALFEPIKADYASIFVDHKRRGFALEHVPDDAVVINDDTRRVVSVAALAAHLASLPSSLSSPPAHEDKQPRRDEDAEHVDERAKSD